MYTNFKRTLQIKTLNIIGRGASWEDGMKHSGDKWCVNVFRDGCQAMFQMHDTDKEGPATDALKAEMQKARDAGAMIYTLDNYPKDRMIEHFQTEFFSHSICYMLALGIYLKYEAITLWGCNIKSGEVTVHGHPGTEFWLGYAMGRGIRVSVQGDSYLLRIKTGSLYGYNEPQGENK